MNKKISCFVYIICIFLICTVKNTFGDEEKVTFTPKIIVESYKCVGEKVEAGKDVKLSITLRNTSKDTDIKNMTVVVSLPEGYFILNSKSDTKYIETFKAGTAKTVSFDIHIGENTPAGQYNIPLYFDYADERGMGSSGNGFGRIFVNQTSKVEFGTVYLTNSVEVGDLMEVSIQAINLENSKISNVRAVIEVDGLNPESMLYIGDVEAKSQGNATVPVRVSSISDSQYYGPTEGNIIFYYEDSLGVEHTTSQKISTVINSPFTPLPQEEEKGANQWWIIMGIIVLVIMIFVDYFVVVWIIKKNSHKR